MKRYIVLLSLIIIVVVLSACSSKKAVELIDTKVDIINDKERIGSMILQTGEKEGQEVVATSLYYAFSIKNEGSKKIGHSSEGLKIKIEPHEKLLTVSKEVMGFNIFNPAEFDNSGLGYGHSFNVTEGQYILHYDLSSNEETTEVLLAPSKEQLDKLKNNALEATLIVLLDNEEIARFDLSKKE